uniref:Uncharacterized protein n=1 Tax=Ciona intestinalis TaxID=7719 RepID=H2XW43_CIOIN
MDASDKMLYVVHMYLFGTAVGHLQSWGDILVANHPRKDISEATLQLHLRSQCLEFLHPRS